MKQVYPGSERIFVSVRVAALRTLCDEMEALMPVRLVSMCRLSHKWWLRHFLH